MRKKPNGARTAGIVITAALLVFGVLLAAFLSNVRGSTRDAIVLPDVAVQPLPPPETPTTQEQFLQVDRENVQQLLQTLQRPAAYHQSLMLITAWEGGSGTKLVEIWRSGELARVQITETGRKRYVLCDGESAWVWYDAERQAIQFSLDETRTLEDLIGVDSYETVAALAPSHIAQGGFVPLDSVNSLYLKTNADESGSVRQYWIDAATQLLYKAEITQDGACIYQLLQTGFEQLTPDDTALQALMALPDGTKLIAQ